MSKINQSDNKPTQTRAIACVLIGLRGSGKSTLGRLLAARIGGVFIDLDDRTAEALGEPTAGQALQIHGQQTFRQAEAQQLKNTLNAITTNNTTRVVLALGGGTPTAPTAADQLRDFADTTNARIFYLRASPQTLRERLAQTNLADRPSLTNTNDNDDDTKNNNDPAQQTLREIDDIFKQRDALYASLAEVIDIDEGLTTDQLVATLANTISAG